MKESQPQTPELHADLFHAANAGTRVFSGAVLTGEFAPDFGAAEYRVIVGTGIDLRPSGETGQDVLLSSGDLRSLTIRLPAAFSGDIGSAHPEPAGICIRSHRMFGFAVVFTGPDCLHRLAEFFSRSLSFESRGETADIERLVNSLSLSSGLHQPDICSGVQDMHL